ncbi:MAG: hypothetical protein V4843_02805 [Pseudomonadota bacterium]|uniref:hypothetical protein n=1 Tax=Acidovorax sp. GW101-3H11 TaxID=1813946 RepID=UPI0007B5038E|nr:hypothetical protein [Acidovorax sp. GW101-3H11]KZT13739.1 hypothetical protein A1D30_21750 [Acidovorax sp. GW101-3H11]
MHEPEKFQQETIKAITDLQETFRQTMSRQLALGAMVKSILNRVPLAALPSVLEEYEAEVDHQVALMPPKFQQPKHWEEWSGVIEARIKQLQQAQGPKTPGQG